MYVFEKVVKRINGRDRNEKEKLRKVGNLKLFNKVLEAHEFLSVVIVNFCENILKSSVLCPH